MAANKIMPSTGNIGMPGLYTLIHERYREPRQGGGQGRGRLSGWHDAVLASSAASVCESKCVLLAAWL